MVTASKYRITGKELIQTIDNWEHLINFIIFAEALLEKGKVPDDFLNKVAAHK